MYCHLLHVQVHYTKEKTAEEKRFQVVLVVFCFSAGMTNLSKMKANIQTPYGIEIAIPEHSYMCDSMCSSLLQQVHHLLLRMMAPG